MIQPETGGTKARSAQRAEARKVYRGRRRRRQEHGAKGEADMIVVGEAGEVYLWRWGVQEVEEEEKVEEAR